ncbi:hypothetical protein KX729_10290 [Rhizobium sp. XQZ8]|uniref:hypothetical protein n=1 Tax=Rhizobium populisoli TaxID=2859785 RepID=UPI001CA5C118|nr:hypothetical protein [Rhizobium populisoli]MBW6421832.1 hypothetical protein [Rhizobium populisoli]
MKAYDIEVLHRGVERSPDCHGWLFGLPPSITPDQWPLDPNSGYPLMHGFTLFLPEDYRILGSDVVALSFFGTAPDHFDGAPLEVNGMREKVEAMPAHPRLHRMTDIVFCEFALILLTRAEFDGPLCLPPEPIVETPHPPLWMTIGAGASYERTGGYEAEPGSYLMRMLGEKSPPDLTYTRKIRLRPRANDPNAGKPPIDRWGQDRGDYESPFFSVEEYQAAGIVTEDGEYVSGATTIRPWAQDYLQNHIGGTTVASDVPYKTGPCYLEFEEWFGGYNFGGRSRFLDLGNMKIS